MLGRKVFKPMQPLECRRCGKIIAEDEEVEFCRVCFGDLCQGCWDEHGECGHGDTEKGIPAKPSWPACTRCGLTDPVLTVQDMCTERVNVGREGRHLCAECERMFYHRDEGEEVLTRNCVFGDAVVRSQAEKFSLAGRIT